MKRRHSTLWGSALALAVVTTMSLAGGVADAATSTISPFDPPNGDNGATQGTISFYDDDGLQITGGDLGTGPSFAAADTDTGRVGDTLASLYAATPVEGLAPGDWSSELLAAPDVYSPPATLPGDLAGGTTAVVSGPFGEWMDLDNGYPSNFPNSNATQSWQNLYQLRILTSGTGQAIDTSRYSSATILIDPDAGTWSQVFPRPLVTPMVTSPATITGTPATGEELTCDVSFDGTDSVGFVWLRDDNVIDGATSATYTAKPADYLKDLACKATGTSSDEISVESMSDPVSIQLGASLQNVKAPRVIGKKSAGEIVSCQPGTWSPKAGIYHYRWLRNGHLVNGAMNQLFFIPRSFSGAELSCRVTASKKGFANGVAVSNTAIVG